jgi:hypothetical protein
MENEILLKAMVKHLSFVRETINSHTNKKLEILTGTNFKMSSYK